MIRWFTPSNSVSFLTSKPMISTGQFSDIGARTLAATSVLAINPLALRMRPTVKRGRARSLSRTNSRAALHRCPLIYPDYINSNGSVWDDGACRSPSRCPPGSWIRPPCCRPRREWLAEDHQVYFLLDLVDELDLSEILIPTQTKDPHGEKGFDPSMMTMLLLYS